MGLETPETERIVIPEPEPLQIPAPEPSPDPVPPSSEPSPATSRAAGRGVRGMAAGIGLSRGR